MRRLIVPLLFGGIGTAVLLALGFWQVQRLHWKLGIIATVESRLGGEAVRVPDEPQEALHEYLRVRATGELLPGEVHVYTSAPPHGVGYRVIAPMRLADGRRILLDRGFVPVDQKDAARSTGPISVEGALLWPDENDLFASPPDLDRNIWIIRDVSRMAEALDTLPVLLVAAETDAAGAPMPLPVSANIRNQHLGYAITWFGLAAVWAGMTAHLLWRIQRRTV